MKRIYEWFLMTFTKHKMGYHGAIMLETKDGAICAECKKTIKTKK
jgi:hypothetical protein